MKWYLLVALMVCSRVAFAGSLPVFITQPTNQTVYPGNNATWTVSAAGATGYHWIFNGVAVPGATNSTFTVTNAQSTNCGYYLVLAQNATGWVPSQMAYLFLDYTYGVFPPPIQNEGKLPFSNTNNTYFAGDVNGYGGTPNNGTVQIVAGPQLDEMSPVGHVTAYSSPPRPYWFTNGFYAGPDQSVSNIAPGQLYYYSVQVLYTNGGIPYVQPSTVMLLNAGTNGSPAPPAYGLKFPGWVSGEGPEPTIQGFMSPADQIRVAGETIRLTNSYGGYTDYGIPYCQWRKNGVDIGSTQSFTPDPGFPEGATCTAVLTISNAQPSDSGIYDLDVRGNLWFIGPKIFLSIQTSNGPGVFQNPYRNGTNVICNVLGAPTRSYDVQWSSNLLNWTDLYTISNATGAITFTDSPSLQAPRFYRTVLLDQ